MPDSKISQLNEANRVFDNDLMVVVTGYNIEGSLPDNCKIPLSKIRHDIVRLNEMIFAFSGFSGYYNTVDNTLTITSHHKTENLIRIDYDNVTPYRQIIYNTGLNAIAGNLIEIQFQPNSDAANILGLSSKLGSKYFSGIISVTGLNVNQSTGNLITNHIQNTWPYTSTLHTTGLNIESDHDICYTINNNFPYRYSLLNINRAKNLLSPLTLYNNNSGSISNTTNYTDSGLLIDYSNLYTSKPLTYVNLLCEYKTLYDDHVTILVPEVPGLEATNDRKNTELAIALATTYSVGSITSCTTLLQGNSYVCDYTTKTLTDPAGLSASGWEPISLTFISGSFQFNINLVGGSNISSLNRLNRIDYSLSNISFTGSPYGGNIQANDSAIIDINRYNIDYKSKLNNIDPIALEYFRTIYTDNSSVSSQNSIVPTYSMTNIGYQRTYRKIIGYEDMCISSGSNDHICVPNTNAPIYRTYTTPIFYAATSFEVGKRYFKTVYLE